MSDKTREVYKETREAIPDLNPFVEMPRMRVSAVNRLNELIKRDRAMAIVKVDNITDYTYYKCPVCGMTFSEQSTYHFCPKCGQRMDMDTIAL